MIAFILMLAGAAVALVSGFRAASPAGSIFSAGLIFAVFYFVSRAVVVHNTLREKGAFAVAMLFVLQVIFWSIPCAVMYLIGRGVGKIVS